MYLPRKMSSTTDLRRSFLQQLNLTLDNRSLLSDPQRSLNLGRCNYQAPLMIGKSITDLSLTISVRLGTFHYNYSQENICKNLLLTFSYKFNVDNEWVCTDDDIKDTDINGNINNYILVE